MNTDDTTKYVLTVVRSDGVSHSSSYLGWYRESSSDRDFDDVTQDKRTLYACVTVHSVGDGEVRREYIKNK